MRKCIGYGKWKDKCRREGGEFCSRPLCDDCQVRYKRDLKFKLIQYNKKANK